MRNLDRSNAGRPPADSDRTQKLKSHYLRAGKGRLWPPLGASGLGRRLGCNFAPDRAKTEEGTNEIEPGMKFF